MCEAQPAVVAGRRGLCERGCWVGFLVPGTPGSQPCLGLPLARGASDAGAPGGAAALVVSLGILPGSDTFHFAQHWAAEGGREGVAASPVECTARHRGMEERVTYADLHFPPPPAPQRLKQLPWRCAALSLALLCLLLLLAQIVLVGLSFHFLGQLAGCTHDPWSTEESLSGGRQSPQGRCQFCPAGWFWDAGQCYYFSSAKKTWEQSKEDCCSRGAQLVTIRTNATLAFLTRMSDTDMFHVGLKRDSSRADWKWLDGTALKGLFPIQRFTSSFLACGRVSGSGLSGGPCGEARGWICEKSAAALQWVQSAPPTFLWGNTTYTCAGPW